MLKIDIHEIKNIRNLLLAWYAVVIIVLFSMVHITEHLNINGKCATKPPPVEPKFNLPLIIGLSAGGLLLLLIIFGVLFKMK